MNSVGKASLVLLALCLGSRILSAIYYIEDPDSLRFALGVVDYDLTQLQPHFPGYPVFCWAAKLVYALTGRYSVAFALLGGLATFGMILGLLKIAGEELSNPRGMLLAALAFVTPLFWLMGNRYMPDLSGLACLLAAFYFLTNGRNPLWGGLLTGLLAGIRLSYMPFLFVPVSLCLIMEEQWRWKLIGAVALGVAVWLVPLIGITGWDELIAAAQKQTSGHFGDFGGTIQTEPDLYIRAICLIEGMLADGLGLFWSGRNWSTGIATLGLCICLVLGLKPLFGGLKTDRFFWVKVASWSVYLIWIFVGQNVIYKSRHILPLLPFVLLSVVELALALGAGRTLRQCALAVFLVAQTYVTANLVVQHTRPTAIAQIKAYLQAKSEANLHVVTVPLIKYYLTLQGVQATYLVVETDAGLKRLDGVPSDVSLVTIGSPYSFPGRPLKMRSTFYHNPYVNRMWPEIVVYEY